MSVWIALLIAVAAVSTTYVCCIRPLRRGRCTPSSSMARRALGSGCGSMQRTETGHQLAELLEDVRILRAQDALGSGQKPHTGHTGGPSGAA